MSPDPEGANFFPLSPLSHSPPRSAAEESRSDRNGSMGTSEDNVEGSPSKRRRTISPGASFVPESELGTPSSQQVQGGILGEMPPTFHSRMFGIATQLLALAIQNALREQPNLEVYMALLNSVNNFTALIEECIGI